MRYYLKDGRDYYDRLQQVTTIYLEIRHEIFNITYSPHASHAQHIINKYIISNSL